MRFASLETSFHAANHTIPPPPSHEGYPHGPKDKNRSPFHGEKPLMIKYFLGKKLNLPILNGRDAILRVRVKWLIFNIVTIIGGREISRPYRVWFFAEGERFLSFWRCHRPRKRASLKGCFLCFCFSPSSIYPLNPTCCGGFVKKMWRGGGNCGGNVYLCV